MTKEPQGIGRFFLHKSKYETIDGRVHTLVEKVWDRHGPSEEGPDGRPVKVKKENPKRA